MHGTIVAFQRNMYNAVQEINMASTLMKLYFVHLHLRVKLGGAGNTDVMVLS